jgi:putative ABC transport system permease protein
MGFREAVRLALQVIWAQKMKSSFSIIGVFIGVTFLIAVVSIVEGMNSYMTDRFASTLLGVNTFQLRRYPNFIMEDVSRETRREWRRRPRIMYDDADAVAEGMTVPVLVAWNSTSGGEVAFEGRAVRDVEIIGATEQYFQIKAWEFAHGRPFSGQEVRAGQPVVVLGQELAERLFEGRDPIGREVKIRTIDELLVKAESEEDLRTAMVDAEAIMRSRRGLRPRDENNFAIETSEALLDFWGSIRRVLMMALPGLVSISLVVGGIVIMNIMLMAVAERTREIGIRKALGARRGDILRQFLVEAATLSTAGAAIGIGTGLGLAALVQATTFLPAKVAPVWIVVAVVLGAGVGITAGLYPASRAARLDPIEAMRQE